MKLRLDQQPNLDWAFGLSIYGNPFLTVSEQVTKPRTWRERFFSWPWLPWQSIKVVTVQRPDPHVYIIGQAIIAHPAVASWLRDAIKQGGQSHD